MTARLLELLDARPGERVLELGAGLGEVGEVVAQVVGEGGEVVVTDNSPAMVQAAQKRLGVPPNVRYAVANAEATRLETASFDRVVARFALMLVPDVGAGFAETRRLLRAGGRLAFSVWTSAPENPWGSTIGWSMLRLGLVEPQADVDAPGPFRLSDPDRLRSLIGAAGLAEPRLETVELELRYGSVDEYWDVTRDLSSMFRTTLERLTEPEVDRLRQVVAEALEPYRDDGGIRLPGRAWVGAADAD